MDAVIGGEQAWVPKATLPARYYTSDEVFAQEQEQLFFDSWFCIGRAERVENPSDFIVVDVTDQSIIVTRNKQGALRAFYNTCAHRGTQLCDAGSGHARSGVFVCPYHAWSYTTDGALVGTPNVHPEEGFDRAAYGLHPVAVDTWEGFLFLHLGEDPPPLADYVEQDPGRANQFDRYALGELRVGASLTYDTAANWKIVVENYSECLHCPTVHPELVGLVPVYRTGSVVEDPNSWGVHLAEGARTFTKTGTSSRPNFPGISDDDANCYYGTRLFPNMTLDLVADCVIAGTFNPVGPGRTIQVLDFLFRPETIADPAFDPSDLIEFDLIVSGQDQEVCERAQVGVRSRGYRNGGVFPYADRFVYNFNSYYLERMGLPPSGPR